MAMASVRWADAACLAVSLPRAGADAEGPERGRSYVTGGGSTKADGRAEFGGEGAQQRRMLLGTTGNA